MSKREERQKRDRDFRNLYYDKKTFNYWFKDAYGNYTSLNANAATSHLIEAGLNPSKDGAPLSEVARELNQIRYEYGVDFAGKLSGHAVGRHTIDKKSMLVIQGYKLVQPKPGLFPLINQIFEGVLGADQAQILMCWLKIAYEALANGLRIAGQALAIAGPARCGKSFIQDFVITPVLGGRSAKCWRYFSGQTQFNGDLCEAEHLIIDDDIPSTKLEARMSLGAQIKSIIASGLQSAHYKGRDAFSFRPFWRLTIMINDDPQYLLTLPVIDSTLVDKFILMKARRFSMPRPTGTAEEQAAFRKEICAELPAFIDHLVNMQIPNELKDERFGVKAYQDRELLVALEDLAPEQKLLSLIDIVLFKVRNDAEGLWDGHEPWTGSASELEAKLRGDKAYQFEANRILGWSNACPMLLGRLKDQCPARVQPKRTASKRLWVINPPSEPPASPPAG